MTETNATPATAGQTDRVAVITGGGRGIGRAVAHRLLADGWRVVVAGRTMQSLNETIADNTEHGLAVETDVGDPGSVEALFTATTKRFGRVDLLFNNAGITAPAATVDQLDIQTWLDLITINVTGSFLCARAAFAQMRDQNPSGGRIINNGSVSATTPRLHSAAYTTSKHAITGLTKSLSLDGRALGIACGQIDFGNISSDMGDQMAQGVLQANGEVAAEPTIPVSHAAEAVAYMAGLPTGANVLDMTLMANGMPFVGRG